MARVDVTLRIRQAILLNDLPLVQRLLRNNPACLHNPDLTDKSNTSLHLAAQYGLVEIVEYLISLGHDSDAAPEGTGTNNGKHELNLGISVNTDGQTPLHLAAAFSHGPVVELLCTHFPKAVHRVDKKGQTPLHLASSSHVLPTANTLIRNTSKPLARSPEDVTTIDTLIVHASNVNAKDQDGNICLHNASAWGNLKAIRALIQAGADPLCKNNAGWTPEFYSITVQAEVYYRNLVAEWEKKKADEESRTSSERRARGGGTVRLVPNDNDDGDSGQASVRTSSFKSQHTSASDSGLGISVGQVDTWK